MTSNRPIEEVGILTVFTLVVWLGCLTIGVAGMLLPYPRPKLAAELPPIEARMMNVRIAQEALVTPRVGTPLPPEVLPTIEQPPPAPAMTAIQSPPELVAALAAPTISFAKPVAAPALVVPAKQAATPAASAAALPAVRQITYGQGEGAQPAPEYPREAVLADQQGTVVVRFTVSPDGSVISAEAKVPCPFPLLNQAALRAIRETWRFQAGPARIYEVSIRFELTD